MSVFAYSADTIKSLWSAKESIGPNDEATSSPKKAVDDGKLTAITGGRETSVTRATIATRQVIGLGTALKRKPYTRNNDGR